MFLTGLGTRQETGLLRQHVGDLLPIEARTLVGEVDPVNQASDQLPMATRGLNENLGPVESCQHLTCVDHFVPRNSSIALEESLCVSENRYDDRGWAHPIHHGAGCTGLLREFLCFLLPQREELRAVVDDQYSVGIRKWGLA